MIISHENQREQNTWQQVSDATHTVITPANAIDAVGFVGAKYGIDHLDTWPGIVIAGASFLTDMVDGKVARATGTQSELGEAIDAVGDKIKLAYALKKTYELEAAPMWLLAGVTVVNSVNASLTLADKQINRNVPAIHPSWAGKRAIFLQQFGIGFHILGSQFEKQPKAQHVAKAFKLSANVMGAAGITLGVAASSGYARTLVKSIQQKRK